MAKENISKMKREPTVLENIFANDTSVKGMILFRLLQQEKYSLMQNVSEKKEKTWGLMEATT